MVSGELSILYQDEHYVAVHKPSGLLVHRSPLDKHETRFCLQMLRDQLGQSVYPCHRLDKPTSGVLLFALDKAALARAGEAFTSHTVRKTYTAVVRGWVHGEGLIDHPLAYVPDGGETRGGGEPQPARSRYRCLANFEIPLPLGPHATARFSEVELQPETGRMHQLRRHLKHLRHPVIGDTRYGDGLQNRFFREHFDSHRLLLMASQLTLIHPLTGKPVTIRRCPDPSYDAVLAKLRLHA
jgi:tRNA pseudouridine65 synthase